MPVAKWIFLPLFCLLWCGCAAKTAQTDATQQQHLKELQSAGYQQYLEMRSSLARDMQSLCMRAVAQQIPNAAACNDNDFLQSQSQPVLQQLCALDVRNACFLGNNLEKACNLGHKEACTKAGLVAQTQAQSLAFLQKACELDAKEGCKALYQRTQSPTQKTELYYRLLDFGEDSVCEGEGCQIQGRFAQELALQNECAKGSGMACVAVVRKMRQTMPRYIFEGEKILHNHCFVRRYAPACEELQEIYLFQKNAKMWLQAGTIACQSEFFAEGILGYEKSPHLCTRVADSIVFDKHSTALDAPKKQAMILYKIGCERGNEEKACANLHQLLTHVSLQTP